ncbi:extracellular serine-rich protein [Apiospora sp. TS-2023a]
MQFTTFALSALMGLATAQKVHVVSVASANNSLIFMPDNLKAAKGDMVQFQFRGGNHSVVQSTFDQPCMPMSMAAAAGNSSGAAAKGIFSGFMPVAASKAMGMLPTYTVMVADEKPMWFYCSQGKHCQAGMVMVLNENTSANATRSLANYKALAKKATANVSPPTPAGGAAGGSAGGNTTGGSGSGSGSGTGSGSGSGSGTGSGSGSGSGTGSAPGSQTSTPTTAGASTATVSTALSLVAMAAAFLL